MENNQETYQDLENYNKCQNIAKEMATKLNDMGIKANLIDDKYFQPEIEDIRVGYECETRGSKEKPFEKEIIDREWTLSLLEEYIKSRDIRVPYLTKEQIEAEGWKQEARLLLADFANKPPEGENLYLFTKNELHMIFKEEVHIVIVYKITKTSVDCNISPEITRESLFNGECKDINTFRYICKLLGI
jgi:hypothetical protein